MTAKNLKTYFFSIHHDGNESFEDGLNSIMEKGLDERIYEGVRLLETEEQNIGNKRFICGDLERIHMDNLPNKSGASEEPDELDLEDDEGLGYNTAFIYYPTKNILGLQSNITGVGYSRFRDYINMILHNENNADGFHINPIIVSDDNAQKVINEEVSPSFKSLTFTIDNPDNFDFVPNDEQASILKDYAKKAKENNAVKMIVTLSAGREKESFLNTLNMLKIIRKGKDSSAIKQLKARASLGGGENTDLNFLPNKLQYKTPIEVVRNQTPLSERIRAILKGFEYYSNYIESRNWQWAEKYMFS